MKYHLQTRLESISPTQKPKNGILLSKVPLRRHPWHGNDWDKSSNCWTWLRWCGERHDVMTHDRGPHFTSFLGWLKRYSLNFHIAEIWDLQLSKVNCEEIERLQLYPPMLWFVPKLSKQIKMAGWCSGFVAFLSFPCKQDSTTNFKKHPNPDYTGQAMVGKNDSAIAGRSWSFPNRMCWDWWRFWRLHE